MRIISRATISSVILGSVLCGPVLSQDDGHAEHGAHQHGLGVLNIAIEGSRVDIALEIPSHDIVGFEHAAVSDEEKSLIARAKVLLGKPLNVFAPASAAGCNVVSSSVLIDGDGSHSHEHGDHDHDHDDKDHAHDSHGTDEHAEHGSGHSEVHATYTLKCSSPGKLNAFNLTLFELFPNAVALDVNVVTDSGQFRRNVTRERAQISMDGGGA